MKAKEIEKIVQTGASHVLYRKTGDWYHHLKQFPGVLFDKQGYVRFETEDEYRNSSYLQHGEDLHVKEGISSLPSYTLFTGEQKNRLTR